MTNEKCLICEGLLNYVLEKGDKNRKSKVLVCVPCKKFYKVIPARVEEL